jgi:hypothetical protein
VTSHDEQTALRGYIGDVYDVLTFAQSNPLPVAYQRAVASVTSRLEHRQPPSFRSVVQLAEFTAREVYLRGRYGPTTRKERAVLLAAVRLLHAIAAIPKSQGVLR